MEKNKVIIRVPNTSSDIKIIEEGLATAKKNLADKIIILDQGKVIFDGVLKSFLTL